jgi:hypothetical protein
VDILMPGPTTWRPAVDANPETVGRHRSSVQQLSTVEQQS